ncbi:CidA/LrgA family holin-like protein [Halobacillus litoralis]|uniref:CidA/LrgA family holin-like protein n=1 Tax=Halobacillus litoralis TaxID=45668 RepID=A0A845F6F2_9BACI|nr:CidA/LrgA family protein [Halobacillus sp. HZG1]MEC3884263.1 CidA/LrgA family protein [Halobacillus sp. HZG1]MYL69336.1 CidA/LrgA family holin-like protein [Halobacillus litoralis]
MSKAVTIILQITGLYIIYLFGTFIQKTFNLFIPGSVIGLVFLFALLSLKIVPEHWVNQGVGFMIKHLPFFFIPATVGVMSYAYVFEGKGVLLILIGLLSTAMVMGISGFVAQWMARRREAAHE